MKRLLLAVGLAAAFASVISAGQPERYLHVKVDDSKNGETVRVNLPLSLAEKVLPTIHHGDLHDGKVTLHEAKLNGVDLKALLQAVESSPDNELVTVKETHQNVRVAKSAGNLVVEVRSDEAHSQKVDVTVPMRVVQALISPGGQELDVLAAVRELEKGADTFLVQVQDAAQIVRVWVDGKSAAE